MAEVKEQRITNETVRKKFLDITNIKKQIATQQPTFIGKWHATLTTIFPPNFSPRGTTTRDDVEVYCIQTINTSFTTSASVYLEWTKPEGSKHGHTFPSMTDTGNI